MDPAQIKMLATSTLPPLLLALAVFVPIWWRRRGEPTPISPANTEGDPRWAAPVVLGLAGIAVPWIALGAVKLPPKAAAEWIPIFAAVGLALGLLATRVRFGAVVRWLVRGLVLLAAGGAPMWRRFADESSRTEAIAWTVGFAMVMAVVWWALERSVDRVRGAGGPGVLLVFAFGASQVLVLGYYSVSLAQIAAGLAAALGVAMVMGLLRPRFTLAFGGVHAVVLVVGPALLQGMLFGQATMPVWWFAPAVLASPLMALLADAPMFAKLTGWKAAALRVGLASIPMLAGVGLAAATYQFPDAASEYQY
ncbi:MAG: hypothetical protein SFY95_12800 [Planctomycetota bacterium]|nr:hypothetical protein [Planctomycetota bacterium]